VPWFLVALGDGSDSTATNSLRPEHTIRIVRTKLACSIVAPIHRAFAPQT
jgi:hypothetical protein